MFVYQCVNIRFYENNYLHKLCKNCAKVRKLCMCNLKQYMT